MDVINFYGKRIMLSHGDAFCTDDVDYQKFKLETRNSSWINSFLQKPLDDRLSIANDMRSRSKSASSNKPENIMDTNSKAILDCIKNNEIDILIHGHTHRPEIKTFDFDKDADDVAQFAIAFPKSWNEGTITFQAFFTADSTNTGTVSWGLSAVAIADNDSINTAFGTQVAPTAKAHSGTANDLDVTAESGAVTIAGSPSTDEQVFFQISRDVSEDSLTADAKLLGVKIFFTTDAANDA